MSDRKVMPKRNIFGRFLGLLIGGVLGFSSLIVIFALYRVYKFGLASLSDPSFLKNAIVYCILVAIVSFILSIVKAWQESRRSS